jgi:cation diffusion facilitator CzcD-associated flavoprotein CzcO
MRNLNRTVIIGAGAAGLTTAESLRRLGFGGNDHDGACGEHTSL